MHSYTVYGAGITPALLGSVFWNKVTKISGISSMLTGVILTLLWEALGQPFGLESVIISAPAAIVVLIVVTLATAKETA